MGIFLVPGGVSGGATPPGPSGTLPPGVLYTDGTIFGNNTTTLPEVKSTASLEGSIFQIGDRVRVAGTFQCTAGVTADLELLWNGVVIAQYNAAPVPATSWIELAAEYTVVRTPTDPSSFRGVSRVTIADGTLPGPTVTTAQGLPSINVPAGSFDVEWRITGSIVSQVFFNGALIELLR
jgi:hypothetical protein